MRWREYVVKGLGLLALGWSLSSFLTASAIAQQKAEASNMELVGHNDLQGRPGYRPVVKKQGERWIAYIGTHDGAEPALNPLTGKVEPSGTVIVDVTDPSQPKTLAHIPSEPNAPEGEHFSWGSYPAGAAEYVRVCGGSELPHGEKGKFYMLRNFGRSAWEMWDVTDPANARKMNDIVTGLTANHEPWWECDTGIAYMPSGLHGWPLPPKFSVWSGMKTDVHPAAIVHMLVYDLSDPAKPVLIREWGIPGQNAGSTVPAPVVALHQEISTGPKGNRLYVCYGPSSRGIYLSLDREKLLNGPKEPTDENLRYPVIARVDYPHDMGCHTAFPLLQMELPEFAKQAGGRVKDFLAVVGEQWGNECKAPPEPGIDGTRQMVHIFDISDETHPVGVSTWTVPEASGNFCSRGGRFGSHESQNTFDPIYYKRVLFVAHFNAGVRAVDIRDPYHPKEIAYYIPGITKAAGDACSFQPEQKVGCGKKVIMMDHMDVDARGYIYIVDRQGSGMDILQLTGPARQVANLSQTASSAERQ
jgi:hypothetical protein